VIAIALSILNVAGFGFAIGTAEPTHALGHGILAFGFGLWATRLRQGPRGGGELARMQDLLEQQEAALEDARAALSTQSFQLAELQERVDFAERVLVQARERAPLENREKRE